jgi:hypothetical protein
MAVQRLGHQRRQQPAELLLLDQTDLAVAEWLDGEDVLAVEDAGRDQPPKPAQPPAGSASSTVGRKVMARPPTGCMRLRRRSPTRALPRAWVMNGFHSG